MKKKNIPVEFIFQMFALIIAIIVVHAFYVSVVRPNAAQVIEEQNMQAAANPDFVRERSPWVLIKDLEQESCFILMFWALATELRNPWAGMTSYPFFGQQSAPTSPWSSYGHWF